MLSWRLLTTLLLLASMVNCFKLPVKKQVEQGPLDGIWFNELGSCMLVRQSENGDLSGFYYTAVGTPGQGNHSLLGRVGEGDPTTFGFAVSWQNGGSATAWSGQYQTCAPQCAGGAVLRTTWLLTSRYCNSEDSWKSTLVNQDTFTRVPQVAAVEDCPGPPHED